MGLVSRPSWVVSGGPGRPARGAHYAWPYLGFSKLRFGLWAVGLDPVSSPKAGPYPFGPSSLEGSRRLKALETIGAPGPAGRDDCRGPPQSLVGCFRVALPIVWAGPNHLRDPDAESFPFWEKDGRRKQIEEERYSVERSRTDNSLIEEASRYGCAPNPSGLLVSGSHLLLLSFSVGLHWGSIATFLGMIG